jgi:hypothetical protein
MMNFFSHVLVKGLYLALSLAGLFVRWESQDAFSATVHADQGHGRIGETNLAELVEGAYRAIGHLVGDPLW